MTTPNPHEVTSQSEIILQESSPEAYAQIEGLEFGKYPNSGLIDCASYIMRLAQGKTVQPGQFYADFRRQPSEPYMMENAYLWMLEQGLNLHSVDPYDAQRFYREGIAYLEEQEHQKGKEPDESFYQFWTPKQIETQQGLDSISYAMLSKYDGRGSEGRWSEEVCLPEPSDMQYFISIGHVVLAQEAGKVEGANHTVAFSRAEDPTKVRYFNSALGRAGFGVLRDINATAAYETFVNYKDGIIAVSSIQA